MNQADTMMAVQRMQEYMEAHIYEVITLKQLSHVAGYSPSHSARIFKDMTGIAPFDYLRALRLTKAALVLRDVECRIIDVALDFVFDSHEGFTRAFSKQFGLPPKRYSQHTPPIQLFMPEKVLNTYQALNRGGMTMTKKEVTKSVFVQIVERPARKVLLKRGIKASEYFAYCEEVDCDVWSMLTSVKEAMYEPIGMWLLEHLILSGTSQYVQGVELPLDYSNAVPDGYDCVELPPCKMMVFQSEPYNDDDFQAAIGETWDHINKFNPTIYGYHWAPEAAPRFQLAPMVYRGYIEARPVVAVN